MTFVIFSQPFFDEKSNKNNGLTYVCEAVHVKYLCSEVFYMAYFSMRPVSFLTLYGLDKDDIDKLDRFLLLLENLTVGEWINERKERNRLGIIMSIK